MRITRFNAHLLGAAVATLALFGANAGASPLSYELTPYYTTVDDPAYNVVDSGGTVAGMSMSGMALLAISTSTASYGCSGSLLSTGRHVLTAAHCLTDGSGNLIALGGSANFAGQSIDFSGANITIHSNWDGNFFRGNDIAVIELDQTADSSIQRYDIDRGKGAKARLPKRIGAKTNGGIVGDKLGFGLTGTGDTGMQSGTFGTLRTGQNTYDAFADILLRALGLKPNRDFVSGSVFLYDFDDGTAAHDAMGTYFGLDDLGLGAAEVMSAPGDSGGATFIDGVIAGITSYGLRIGSSGGSTDVDGALNSSYGELAGDTRVSKYARFIDSVTGVRGRDVSLAGAAYSSLDSDATGNLTLLGYVNDPIAIPEPDGIALVLAGLAAMAWMRRFRPRVAPVAIRR